MNESQTWHERFNLMKKRNNWTLKDISVLTGIKENTIRSQITRGKKIDDKMKFPAWLKLAIIIDELYQDKLNKPKS